MIDHLENAPIEDRPAEGLGAARLIWHDRFHRPLGTVMLLAALALLILAGYYFVYQFFFAELPLEKLAYKSQGGAPETFRYDQVADFHGRRLRSGEQVTLKYYANAALASARGKRLEIFVRLPEGRSDGRSPGNLYVRYDSATEAAEHTIRLLPDVLQRHAIPFVALKGADHITEIRYKGRGGSKAADVLVATNLRNISLWPRALAALIASAAMLVIGLRLLGALNFRLLGGLAIIGTVGALFHGGMFISNDFTQGHLRFSGLCLQTENLLETGYFSSTMYRNSGAIIVPLAAVLLEGGRHSLHGGFARIYPSTRYIMFAWFMLAVAGLVISIHYTVSPALAFVAGLLHVLYWPFIVDLYYADADALLIPLMVGFTAMMVPLLARAGIRPSLLTGLGLTMYIMIAIKITPIVLVAIAPAAILLRDWRCSREWWSPRAAMVLVILAAAAWGGKASQRLGEHPEAHIGVPGVKWARSVFWHMAWAAAGHFDHHGPFGFTKSGGLRNKRVAEATGLPEERTFIRHSQLATDVLYKPGVTAALRERPGVFVANAWLRLRRFGLYFFQLQEGCPWVSRGVGNHSHLTAELREGTAWKITPIWFLASWAQVDLSPALDGLFLALAVLGLFLVRSWHFAAFGLACFAVRMAYLTGVHGLHRYGCFLNVVLLIGLAALLLAIWRTLAQAALQDANPSPSPATTGSTSV